ncbi:galactose-specific lectin nattectin-like isoform X1 [Brachyhypopomus gauderio]|uniref:galactose-specific lectin nattectin-like isoform X1 n=1 Tax=Brachyhypopomus gauderio TaxID=698409 RepID=UPI004042E0AD
MAIWKVALLLCLVLTGGTAISQGGTEISQETLSCPYPWTLYGQRCYRFFSSYVTWAEAESTCLRHGGNLASVHTISEYKFLQNLIKKMSGSFLQTWIGGYDAVKEGQWFWSDGTEGNFYFWASQQPDNYLNNENCMQMNAGEKLKMNDSICSNHFPFVCKKRRNARI